MKQELPNITKLEKIIREAPPMDPADVRAINQGLQEAIEYQMKRDPYAREKRIWGIINTQFVGYEHVPEGI